MYSSNKFVEGSKAIAAMYGAQNHPPRFFSLNDSMIWWSISKNK